MRSRIGAIGLLLAGCAGEEEPLEGIACEPTEYRGEAVSYDPDAMVCVDLQMVPGDFDELSTQYRFGGESDEQWPQVIKTTAMSCSEPYPDHYTYFPADVAVDGLEQTDIGVRRKGFLGSVVDEDDRPSLKISADEYIEDQLIGETERLTLNNNAQDWSRVRTCLSYSVFADADYPAPLCNLANVMVNGEPLGTYTHVESVKKRFLRRAFGNDEGSLYEGTVADFTDAHLARLPASLGRFEAKTGDTDASGERLEALAEALKVPDDQLEEALSEVIDVDLFVRFWALETLIGHGDGYAANTNNFFVYFDPDRGGRGVFVPWGADDTFWGGAGFYTTGELVRRMSRHPELNQRYLDELEHLLDEVWSEDRLNARIDGWAVQVASAERDLEIYEWSTDQLRRWIGGRRATIEAFIADGGSEGAPEQGPCTGSRDPADFVLVAELGTVASMGCSHVSAVPTFAWLVLGLLAWGRRR